MDSGHPLVAERHWKFISPSRAAGLLARKPAAFGQAPGGFQMMNRSSGRESVLISIGRCQMNEPGSRRLPRKSKLFFWRADEEDWNRRVVPDLGDGAAVEDVAEQPVAVSGHRNQIASFLPDPLEDFLRRIAISQF